MRYAGNMTEPTNSPERKPSGLEGEVAALLDHDMAEMAIHANAIIIAIVFGFI